MKLNDRLQRVQVDRHESVPLGNIWYLVVKDNDWDTATSLGELDTLLAKHKYHCLVFAVWHGNWRTNLFLMPPEFLKTALQNCNNVKQKASK
jgi:hypothetical protein